MSSSQGNVHFACVARLDRGEAIIIASHSNNSETDLDGVKQVLQQPNISMTAGKHYSFSAAGSAWHLITDQTGLIYILISQLKYPQRGAHAALEELQQSFSAKFGDRASTSKAGGLNKAANPVLTGVCSKYDDLASVDRMASVNKKVDTVKLVMQENVDMALQNCVKLEHIERAAEELQQQAGVFKHNAKELKKKMWWKKTKMQLLVAFLVLAVLGAIIAIIVVMTDDKKKD